MALVTQSQILELLPEYGLAIVVVGVAIESLGVPLPGGLFVVAAAFFAGSTGRLDPVSVFIAGACGGAHGDNLGYWIGRYLGMKALVRHGPRFGWTQSRIKVGRYLFARFGVLAVFLGRFVALVRALAAMLAGVNRMRWWMFMPANAMGCIVWSAAVTQSGYAMGLALDSTALTVAPERVGLAGVVIILAVILLLKALGGRLVAAADRADPGPTEV